MVWYVDSITSQSYAYSIHYVMLCYVIDEQMEAQVETPKACVARVQYAFLSSLALVPTQSVMYAAQPASDPDCN